MHHAPRGLILHVRVSLTVLTASQRPQLHLAEELVPALDTLLDLGGFFAVDLKVSILLIQSLVQIPLTVTGRPLRPLVLDERAGPAFDEVRFNRHSLGHFL